MERHRFLAVLGALLALGFVDCSARTERPPDPSNGPEQVADASAGSQQPPGPNPGSEQGASPNTASQPAPDDQPECLSNTEVIELVVSGERDAAIIARLTTSDTCFDVSPAAMIDLRNAGVSPAVIAAMTRAAGRQDS